MRGRSISWVAARFPVLPAWVSFIAFVGFLDTKTLPMYRKIEHSNHPKMDVRGWRVTGYGRFIDGYGALYFDRGENTKAILSTSTQSKRKISSEGSPESICLLGVGILYSSQTPARDGICCTWVNSGAPERLELIITLFMFHCMCGCVRAHAHCVSPHLFLYVPCALSFIPNYYPKI